MHACTQASSGNHADCIISLFARIRGSIGIRARRNLSFSIRIYCEFFADMRGTDGDIERTWLLEPPFPPGSQNESEFMENPLARHLLFLVPRNCLAPNRQFKRRNSAATLYSARQFIPRPPRGLFTRRDTVSDRKSRRPGKNRSLAICTGHKKRKTSHFYLKHELHASVRDTG